MSRFKGIPWRDRAYPNSHGGGNSKQTELLFRVAQGMAADPTSWVMTDDDWADKVIKRTEALIKKLEAL